MKTIPEENESIFSEDSRRPLPFELLGLPLCAAEPSPDTHTSPDRFRFPEARKSPENHTTLARSFGTVPGISLTEMTLPSPLAPNTNRAHILQLMGTPRGLPALQNTSIDENSVTELSRDFPSDPPRKTESRPVPSLSQAVPSVKDPAIPSPPTPIKSLPIDRQSLEALATFSPKCAVKRSPVQFTEDPPRKRQILNPRQNLTFSRMHSEERRYRDSMGEREYDSLNEDTATKLKTSLMVLQELKRSRAKKLTNFPRGSHKPLANKSASKSDSKFSDYSFSTLLSKTLVDKKEEPDSKPSSVKQLSDFLAPASQKESPFKKHHTLQK